MSKIIFGFLLIFLAGLFFLGSFIFRIHQPAQQESVSDAPLLFTIAAGEGVATISKNLEEQELVQSPFYFKIYARLKDVDSRLQAGTYELLPTITIAQLVDRLAKGETLSNEKTITIVEGLTRQQIAEYLEGEEVATKEEFLHASTDAPIDTYSFLVDKPEKATLEGYLFPDTYRIFKDATAEDIVAKILETFDHKLSPDLRASIQHSGRSVFEVVTLASIIEREAIGAADMKSVAGVFINRLAVGMPLQADSTVNYITGKKTPSVTFEDLKIDSPYNTYKYAGLPPGPISNPGRTALEAAIYPEDNSYWYFLTNLETGDAVFSKTLEEHNANKQKYLK